MDIFDYDMLYIMCLYICIYIYICIFMYQGASSNWFSKGHHKEGVHSRTLPGRSIEEGRQGPPPMPWIQGLIFFGEGWFMIYIYIYAGTFAWM